MSVFACLHGIPDAAITQQFLVDEGKEAAGLVEADNPVHAPEKLCRRDPRRGFEQLLVPGFLRLEVLSE